MYRNPNDALPEITIGSQRTILVLCSAIGSVLCLSIDHSWLLTLHLRQSTVLGVLWLCPFKYDTNLQEMEGASIAQERRLPSVPTRSNTCCPPGCMICYGANTTTDCHWMPWWRPRPLVWTNNSLQRCVFGRNSTIRAQCPPIQTRTHQWKASLVIPRPPTTTHSMPTTIARLVSLPDPFTDLW